MADLTVEQLREMLQEALRPNNSGAPPSTPTPAAAPAPAPAPGLPTAGLVTALIEALGKLTASITGSQAAGKFSETTQIATALGGLKNSSDLASGAISKLAGEIPFLGAALKKAGLDLNEELKIARAGNQIGVGQGDTSDLRERALAAGFKSVQDYIDYLRSSYGNSLRTIGKTADDSAQKLGEVAAEAAKSREGQNLLSKNLITSDQLAQIAGIAAEGKSAMLKDEEGRRALAEETAKLATKMDANAKVTGVSVDQQIKNRKASQDNIDEQMRMGMLANDQQRMQYSQNKTLLEGQGKAMQDVTSTIYAGGRLSRDQQQLLQAATGGRAGQYIQAVREQKRTSGLADDDPRRMEANRRLEAIVANMSAYQASPEFYRRAQTTSNADQMRAARTLQEQNTEKNAIRNIMQESQVSPVEAKRRAEEFGLQQGRGFRQESLYNETQVPNVGAKPYEMLAEANEQVRKTTVALAGELNKLNNSVGRNTEALDKAREYLNLAAGPKGQTQEERDKMVRDYFNSSKEGAGAVPGTGVTGAPIQTANMTVNANGPVTITPTTAPTPATTSPATTPPATTPAPPKETRGKGTYGETGATAEIKDVVAKLHKGETVLTPDQRENMIKDSANAMFDKLLGKKSSKDSVDQNVQYKNVDKNDPEFVKMRQDIEAERAERAAFMRSREIADPMYAGGKRFETYDIREEEAKKKELEAAKITPPEVKKQLTVDVPTVISPKEPAPIKEAPKVEVPKIEVPKIEVPKIEVPKIDIPKIDIAKPKIEVPKIEVPKIDIPKIDIAKPTTVKEQPKVEVPKVETPKVETPKVDIAKSTIVKEQRKVEIPKPAFINDPAQIKTPKVDMSYASRAEEMLERQTRGAFGNLQAAFAKRQQKTGPNITEEFRNYQPRTPATEITSQTSTPSVQPKVESRENVTIKDLNDQLMMLNKSIAQLVQISSTSTNFAEQQIRVTKKLSGNRFG